MTRRVLLTLLTMLTLLTTSTPATASEHSQGLQNILDQITASGASAALAEFRDGQTVWRGSSGHTRLGHSGPAPANGRFRIASVTKTFIATVVLRLVAEGRASLDDTLEHHLPGLVPGGERITLRNLLQHTSGIADYTNFLYASVADFLHKRFRTYTPRELVALAASQPPLFEPGTSWSYSNTNYILLGLVIEHRTGQPLETVVSQRILRPLGLRDTVLSGTSPFIHGPHAHGYLPIERDGQIHPLDITILNPSAPWAAGAIISTTADLNRFYRALLGGHLLPPAQLQQMIGNPTGPNEYGLGIFRLVLPCGITLWGHTGVIQGYDTYAMSTQDGQAQLAISVNPWNGNPGDAILQLIFTTFCGTPPIGTPFTQPPTTPGTAQRCPYLGAAALDGSFGP